MDLAILTEKRYLQKQPGNSYVENIFKEDGLIQNSLESIGIKCSRVAWDDNFNPSLFRYALFRTTWNYFDELNNFINFLKTCQNRVSLINSREQILWNLNKKYLLELQFSGINIPATHFVKKGESCDFIQICRDYNWEDVVIKPCVSAAAWNTHHIKKINSEANNVFKNLVKDHDMLIQVFQKNILIFGEVSIMLIGGQYSHAVLKKAKKDDFRVQDDFGGTVAQYSPSFQEIQFAENVINHISFKPIYARVDIILDNNNRIALSELELIEPEMWFRFCPSAAENIALKIKSHME
mgnify:CR=1 FL=1